VLWPADEVVAGKASSDPASGRGCGVLPDTARRHGMQQQGSRKGGERDRGLGIGQETANAGDRGARRGRQRTRSSSPNLGLGKRPLRRRDQKSARCGPRGRAENRPYQAAVYTGVPAQCMLRTRSDTCPVFARICAVDSTARSGHARVSLFRVCWAAGRAHRKASRYQWVSRVWRGIPRGGCRCESSCWKKVDPERGL